MTRTRTPRRRLRVARFVILSLGAVVTGIGLFFFHKFQVFREAGSIRDRAADAVASLSGRIETLSPLNVLRRGYSLTRTESSLQLVRDSSQIQPGDRLLTKVASGEIVSRVEEVRPQ